MMVSFLVLLFLLAAACARLRLWVSSDCIFNARDNFCGLLCHWRILHRCIYRQRLATSSFCITQMPVPSAFSGSAAMCLPTRPSPCIKRPTSAALSVLNFSTTPDSGSYVFSVSVARGICGAALPSFSSCSPSAPRFLFSSFC